MSEAGRVVQDEVALNERFAKEWRPIVRVTIHKNPFKKLLNHNERIPVPHHRAHSDVGVGMRCDKQPAARIGADKPISSSGTCWKFPISTPTDTSNFCDRCYPEHVA